MGGVLFPQGEKDIFGGVPILPNVVKWDSDFKKVIGSSHAN
jgi:hypothetical protein